jgi:DNA-binding IclR family transcriptional regulator
MSVLYTLVDPKILRILDLFLKNKGKFFHLNKIAREAKVPLSTTFRIVNRLVTLDIVEQTTIDKFKIYRLSENQKTSDLEHEVRKK